MWHLKCLVVSFLSLVMCVGLVHSGDFASSRIRSRYPSYSSSCQGGCGRGGHFGYLYSSYGSKRFVGQQSWPSYPSVRSKGYGERSSSADGQEGSIKVDRNLSYDLGTPSESCRRFLGESSGPRQEFERMRSVHFEAREDPRADPAEIEVQRQEIRQLFRSIEATNSNNCRWVH